MSRLPASPRGLRDTRLGDGGVNGDAPTNTTAGTETGTNEARRRVDATQHLLGKKDAHTPAVPLFPPSSLPHPQPLPLPRTQARQDIQPSTANFRSYTVGAQHTSPRQSGSNVQNDVRDASRSGRITTPEEQRQTRYAVTDPTGGHKRTASGLVKSGNATVTSPPSPTSPRASNNTNTMTSPGRERTREGRAESVSSSGSRVGEVRIDSWTRIRNQVPPN